MPDMETIIEKRHTDTTIYRRKINENNADAEVRIFMCGSDVVKAFTDSHTDVSFYCARSSGASPRYNVPLHDPRKLFLGAWMSGEQMIRLRDALDAAITHVEKIRAKRILTDHREELE
jgi:hypothetical protein